MADAGDDLGRGTGIDLGRGTGDDRAPEGISRREVLRAMGAAGILATTAGSLLSACHEKPFPGVPDVLLVMADDMRADHLPYMPNVLSLIGEQGRSFTQARCNVPLCQPARVGLLTGQMSKHTGELGIGFGGTKLWDHVNTVPGWLHETGYHCGMFGKYNNFWDGFGGIDAPSCYRTWRELVGSTAEGFRVHLNSGVTTITDRYPTDYLADEVLEFLHRAQAPRLAIVTPSQPHAPFEPRADHLDRWLDVVWPIIEDDDVSDKPPWIQALAPLTDDDRALIRQNAIGALQELAAVDDMVLRILSGIDLTRTVVIFTSDNGVHHGEHRRRAPAFKSGPYDIVLRVPLLVRGPGFEPGPDVDVPCLAHQDIAATLLDVGHATAGLPHQAGVSLRALCESPAEHADRRLLHEVGAGYETTGDGITTGPDSPLGFRKLYRYPSVRANPAGPFTYEAYDMDTDPHEHHSWADDPSRRDERDALEAELLALLA